MSLLEPEDPPYTGVDGVNSIFNPQGPQAPIKDSVTWNPVWMYERETLDENQQAGLYHQIYADDRNISEKVWLRMWYERRHLDLEDPITYPAIMQEFTYTLMDAPLNGTLSENPTPQPSCGEAGRTQFVFPVGMRRTDVSNPFGFGLTSFDADFDGVPDIVEVDSEYSLSRKTGVNADFNQNGQLDFINGDFDLLSGDELAVFSIAPKTLDVGRFLQFLDHVVEITGVTNAGVTLRIWYMGDLLPVDLGTQTLGAGEVWSYKTRLPGIQAGVPAVVELGPFFVQATGVDLEGHNAQFRVGRALGTPYANVEAGEPGASLKRFYVDGHEYNVVAIGSQQVNDFCFITIRTPIPKEPVTIKVHSVHLQGYDVNQQLSIMPPYNFEHYIINDVQSDQTDDDIGDLVGPVPPILTLEPEGEYIYHGAYHIIPAHYRDRRAMEYVYVQEERNPQYRGQLLEVYTETEEGEETWERHEWDTVPAHFTEFILPDIAHFPDLYLLTGAFEATQSNHRVKLWFDPAHSQEKYKSAHWLRVYGAGNEGPGDPDAKDIAGYPVEVLPYTDPMAPFDPQADQAPVKDSITFNPAFLSEFQSCQDDPLRTKLYPRISIAGHDALEKVWLRMWYEPDYLDKILSPGAEYRFPAVMQEFTYMFLDTKDEPAYSPAGWGMMAFPSAATQDELYGSFGFGLTTFDADFDGMNDDVVRVHSEETLAAITNVLADFDGNGELDDLDSDPLMNGNELVVFAVEDIVLDHYHSQAMFLDHMVELRNVTTNGRAVLQLWNTGGGLDAVTPDSYNIVPHEVGSEMHYRPGSMGVVGRNKVNVTQIEPGGNNLGSLDGPWFVYVKDINTVTESVTVSIGRALGATHSAIDNGNSRHDLAPGDPWYLKRFFVDGHEYNVVAIRTHEGDDGLYGFKYITIRTPVPKVNFVNAEDSQKLEGYPPGHKWPISVMPPFNLEHTIAVDILDHHFDEEEAEALGIELPVIGELECRKPLYVHIYDEAKEREFVGELKEVLAVVDGQLTWVNMAFHTLPDAYTELVLPAGDLYLLTNSSWLDERGNHVKFWYAPGESEDLFVDPGDGMPYGPGAQYHYQSSAEMAQEGNPGPENQGGPGMGQGERSGPENQGGPGMGQGEEIRSRESRWTWHGTEEIGPVESRWTCHGTGRVDPVPRIKVDHRWGKCQPCRCPLTEDLCTWFSQATRCPQIATRDNTFCWRDRGGEQHCQPISNPQRYASGHSLTYLRLIYVSKTSVDGISIPSTDLCVVDSLILSHAQVQAIDAPAGEHDRPRQYGIKPWYQNGGDQLGD